jgi:hypothetical protein
LIQWNLLSISGEEIPLDFFILDSKENERVVKSNDSVKELSHQLLSFATVLKGYLYE